MSENRNNAKQDVEEEYREYPKAVQDYHRYDDCAEGYKRQKLIILAAMDDDEYRALQDSFKGHIVQKRIFLDKQRMMLKKLAEGTPDGTIYTYCVDRFDGDTYVPLKVFKRDEYDQAAAYAEDMYNSDHICVHLCEGMFDCDGDLLGEDRTIYAIGTWGEELI